MGIALGISSSAFKGIIRHHLSQQCMFSRKETGIDSSYDSSKLFTTIPGTYRVILGSAHPDRHDVLVFFVERHNHLQDPAWKVQKTGQVVLDDSIPVAETYREHIYFVFNLGEPKLLGIERIS